MVETQGKQERESLTAAGNFEGTHHALIEFAVGIGAGGRVVAQGKGMAAALEVDGYGGSEGVVLPVTGLGIVWQGNDGYEFTVDQQFTQRAAVAVPQGGCGVAVLYAQSVCACGQSSAAVAEQGGARLGVEPGLVVLHVVFGLLADTEGLQTAEGALGATLPGLAQTAGIPRADGLYTVLCATGRGARDGEAAIGGGTQC